MKYLRLLAALASLIVSGSALAQVQPGQSPLSGSKGGTGNAFMQFTGPASSLKTYTLPNASDTIATLGAIQTFTAAKTFNAGFTAAQSVFNNPVPFYFIGDIDTAKWAMSLGGYGLSFLSDNTDTYVAPGGSGTKTLASRTYRPKVVITPTGQVNAQSLQTDGLASIGTLAVIGTGGTGGTLYFGPNTTGANLPALGVNNTDNVLYAYSRGSGIDFRSLANVQLLKLSDNGLLQFQGTSSSFPALKRSTTELHVRLADDTGYANLRAADIVSSASVWASAGGNIRWDGGRSAMASPADGIIGLYNNAGTDFGRLQFGGATSAFPALRRSGDSLEAILADASAYAKFYASRLTSYGNTETSASGAFYWLGRTQMWSDLDGNLRLVNSAGTDFGRLQLGGTSSAYPAIKRSGNGLHVRLADDSAYTSIVASNYNADSLTASRLVATDAGKTFASTITSANLAASISDETGSGPAVFGTNPSISGATITGGTVNNTPIGATTPNSGAFTTLTASTPVGVASGGTGGGTASGTLLDNITGFSSTGMLARTAAGTYAFRTVTAPAAGITVSNGNGVSGNPTLALSNDLAALEGLSSTGIARRTGTDAWSVGTSVANSELATMPTGTFKGNVSGSTATPSDLSATQVTAALNALVGDSGSGGTKGLVPAPGAGDAAAGKYLKADGTWAVPAGGGGGGGGMTDGERQNFLLSTIYQSKLFGGYRRLVDLFADGYKASDGINAGSSSNYNLDTTNGRVSPTTIPATSYANTGGTGARTGIITATTSAALYSSTTPPNLVNGSFANDVSNSMSFSGTAVVTGEYIRFDFGSGKVIDEAKWYQDSTPNHGTWKWQGSNDGSSWTDIGGTFTLGGATIQTQTTLSGNTTAYRYYQLLGVSGNRNNAAWIQEIEFKIGTGSGTTNNMTLITTAQATDTARTKARVLIEYDDTCGGCDAVTLNTHLTAEVTCNGGTNWASASLSAVTSYSGGSSQRKVAETTDTTVTSGSSCAVRLKTLSNKFIYVYGLTDTVH